MNDQIITTINPQSSDPQYAALINKVTGMFKLEILKALGNLENQELFGVSNTGANASSVLVHDAVSKYFSRYSPETRKFIVQKFVTREAVNSLLSKGLLTSNISLKSNSSIISQVDIGREYAFLVDTKKFEKIQAFKIQPPLVSFGTLLRREGKQCAVISPSGVGDQITLNGGLKLQLHQVRCVQPTSWELGKDEINMGGAATDEHGNVTKINEFEVRTDFDANVVQDYSPPNILQTFSLSGTDYPKIFAVTLDLAEKDSGGFSDFLQKLYEAVKTHINEILITLGAAAGAAIASAIGGSIGAIGGPLGAVIGAAVGAIIGAIFGWISDALKDDVFTPQLTCVTIPSAGATFNGSLVSPVSLLSYNDHGGIYNVTYSWAVNW